MTPTRCGSILPGWPRRTLASTATPTMARSVTRQSARRIAFIYVTLGAAYRVTDRLRVGATVTDVVSRVVSRLVLSGVRDRPYALPQIRTSMPGAGHPD